MILCIYSCIILEHPVLVVFLLSGMAVRKLHFTGYPQDRIQNGHPQLRGTDTLYSQEQAISTTLGQPVPSTAWITAVTSQLISLLPPCLTIPCYPHSSQGDFFLKYLSHPVTSLQLLLITHRPRAIQAKITPTSRPTHLPAPHRTPATPAPGLFPKYARVLPPHSYKDKHPPLHSSADAHNSFRKAWLPFSLFSP